MSHLSQHREANATNLASIKEQIREHGVEYIYYQTVSLSGRVMAKISPAAQLERNVEKGVFMHRSATADFQVTLGGDLLGGGPKATEFVAMPDTDTFNVLPWDTRIARFLCTIYEPEHRAEVGGNVYAADARGHLKRAHQEFQADTGFELRSGCEPEMNWIGPDTEVKSRPGQGPSYLYNELERVREIYTRVMGYATSMGFDMVEGDYEDAGQIELNWMFDRADVTADRLITYRTICAQVARELGIKASFMPKPFQGSMGNGCHHNLSLWKDGVNQFAEPGRKDIHLTDLARHATAGLLTHASGSMAIMGSTVNSYKRYWDAGMFAPAQVNYGFDDRTCAVRVPSVGRVEYKLPDAAVNPYLSHTALLAAMKDGIDNTLDPDTVAATDLPLTLGESIEQFKQSELVWGAFPDELSQLIHDLRFDEWSRYCAAVTDWERDQYLEFLP
jgi:glutamine synthetase